MYYLKASLLVQRVPKAFLKLDERIGKKRGGSVGYGYWAYWPISSEYSPRNCNEIYFLYPVVLLVRIVQFTPTVESAYTPSPGTGLCAVMKTLLSLLSLHDKCGEEELWSRRLRFVAGYKGCLGRQASRLLSLGFILQT